MLGRYDQQMPAGGWRPQASLQGVGIDKKLH